LNRHVGEEKEREEWEVIGKGEEKREETRRDRKRDRGGREQKDETM
jgi:hypothetical protein